jgi:YD repeat-containing protein
MGRYARERFEYDEQGRLAQRMDEEGRRTRYIYDASGNIVEKELYDPNDPLRFYTCLISYSTKDQDFADRLYGDLKNAGISCWFAPHSIKAGKKLHEQIDEAIRVYQRC